MTNARKLLIPATAGLLALALTGCSVSFEDPEAKPNGSTSASPNATASGDPSATPGSTESPATGEDVVTLPKPRPLPTLQADDKPTYTDQAVSASLATIIADSSALAESKGWYATVGGKVVGAFANSSSLSYNSTYVIAPYGTYPQGTATDLPSGVSAGSLILATAGAEYNAFKSLLGVLTPQGGTLSTLNPNGNPLSDALFAAAAAPSSAQGAKATSVKYGTSKSFGKYAKTPNAYSVLLNPTTSGAFKDVILWVDKVDGKDVIVGVNDVRVGYGSHPSAESGISEYSEVIKASQNAQSKVALSLVGVYWMDITTWWLTR